MLRSRQAERHQLLHEWQTCLSHVLGPVEHFSGVVDLEGPLRSKVRAVERQIAQITAYVGR